MSEKYVKFLVGTEFWLVPEKLVTQIFRDAVESFNKTAHGTSLSWTDQERKAFYDILNHPEVWRPL